MRVFVTGAAGFFGKHLVKRLTELGHRPTALIHPATTRGCDLEDLRTQSVRLVEGDILDTVDALKILIQGHDRLVHAAAIYDLSASPKLVRDVNVRGSLNVMRAAKQLDIRAVQISSATACGVQSPGFNEGYVHTDHLCYYGLTKRRADQGIAKLQANGLKVVTLKPGGLLGPGDEKETGQYIQSLIARPSPFGRGFPSLFFPETQFTFLHVNDLVDATIGALFNEGVIGKSYLIGGRTVTQDQFHNLIAKVHLGRARFRRGYWMPKWFILLMTNFFTRASRALKINPPWGICNDRMRLLGIGLAFDGSLAREELLERDDYRPLEVAITDYFEHRAQNTA